MLFNISLCWDLPPKVLKENVTSRTRIQFWRHWEFWLWRLGQDLLEKWARMELPLVVSCRESREGLNLGYGHFMWLDRHWVVCQRQFFNLGKHQSCVCFQSWALVCSGVTAPSCSHCLSPAFPAKLSWKKKIWATRMLLLSARLQVTVTETAIPHTSVKFM